MAPRILTFEDIVDEKSVELVKLKFKLRNIIHEKRRVYEQITFLEELSYKFVDKIVNVRYRNPQPSFKILRQIREFQHEAMRIENKISFLNLEIQDLKRQETATEGNLKNLEQHLRNFVATRGGPAN